MLKFIFTPCLNLFDVVAVCGAIMLYSSGFVGDIGSVIALFVALGISTAVEHHIP